MQMRCWLAGWILVGCARTASPPAEAASSAPASSAAGVVAASAAEPSSAPAPQPAEPDPAPHPAPEPADSSAAPTPSASLDSAPADDAALRPSSSPVAVITARDVAFLLDYANSAPKQAAEAACDEEARDDLAARGACLQKARDKFLADVLRFRTDAQGRSTFVIYKRSGSALAEVYAASVEFADETPNSVRVKIGAARGQRPLFRSRRELVVGVPNDYTLELDDPELGKLSYSAKIGLVSK